MFSVKFFWRLHHLSATNVAILICNYSVFREKFYKESFRLQ